MIGISTHILDISIGKPGSDVEVTLEYQTDAGWKQLAKTRTNSDGRAADIGVDGGSLKTGIYQLRFDTGQYWKKRNISGFFPHVVLAFEVTDSNEHYHVPLLLSPYSYSTYRGS